MNIWNIRIEFRRAEPPREYIPEPQYQPPRQPEISWGPFDAVTPAFAPLLEPFL